LDRLTETLLKPEVLGEAYAKNFTDKDIASAFMKSTLERGPEALIKILDSGIIKSNENLLIVVDQFEELFRFTPETQEAWDEVSSFVSLLLNSSKHHQIYVTITMRSDYLGECARFHELPEAVNQGLFLVPRLKREDLMDAILGPARVFGGKIDKSIANKLLNEAGDSPDQLPLIQHCLMWMWSKALNKGRDPINIGISDYKGVEGFTGALSRHADKAYNELSDTQKKIAEVLFSALSEWVDEDRQVRRPTKLGDVAEIANVSLQEVKEVVEVFRIPGRNFIIIDTDNSVAADTMIDISHESLIRQWSRLYNWCKEEGQLGQDYQHLEDRAQNWKNNKGDFLRSLDLDNAIAWEKKAKPTSLWAKRYGRHFHEAMDFLDASREARSDEKRKTVTKFIAPPLIIVLIIFSFFTLKEKRYSHWMAMARENMSKKEYEKVVESCEKALFWEDDHAELYSIYGIANSNLEKNKEKPNEKAFKIFTEGLVKDPSYYLFHQNLGHYHHKLYVYHKDNSHRVKAVYHYKRAISVDPFQTDSEVFSNLVNYIELNIELVNNKQNDLGIFADAIEKVPHKIPKPLFDFVIDELSKQDGMEEKVKRFKDTQKTIADNKDIDENIQLGYSLLKNEREKLAVDFFQKAIDIDPEKGWAKEYTIMGYFHLKNRNEKSAVDFFQKAIDIEPEKAKADEYKITGYFYLRNGDKDIGLKYLKTAIERSPHSASIDDYITVITLSINDEKFDEAKKYINIAKEANQDIDDLKQKIKEEKLILKQPLRADTIDKLFNK